MLTYYDTYFFEANTELTIFAPRAKHLNISDPYRIPPST